MKRQFVVTFLTLICAVCFSFDSASAQTPAATPTSTPQAPAATPNAATPSNAAPAANPADVASIDSIITALYDVISGPAGKKRDWDRFRSLFAPGARLIPTGPRRPPGTAPDAPLTGKEEYGSRALTPDEYITRPRLQHLRVATQGGRGQAFHARHQQHSVIERRQAMVGRHRLLGGRDGQDDAAGEIPQERRSITQGIVLAMLIDDFLPGYDVRERHRTRVRAPISEVYQAVRQFDIGGAKLTMFLMRLRGMRAGLSSPSCFTLDDFLKRRFILRGERPNEELLLGLVGRFWTPSGELLRLDAREYRSFSEPGYAKAAWNFSLSEQPDGCVLLETETRVFCLDEASRRRFRLYWLLIGAFSGLIRREMLRAIKRDAESSHAQAATQLIRADRK
jgi:hypothetical protein